nr:hypothetical protein [Pedobacter borealis]
MAAFWLLCPNMGNPAGSLRTAGMEMDILAPLPNDGKAYQSLHYDGYGADHKKVGSITTEVEVNSGN